MNWDDYDVLHLMLFTSPWDLNPGGWDSNPAETYGTWFQDIIKLRFLRSHHRISVQFSHSVVSDYLWPHELQHSRPPCPSPTPGVYPDSCPLSWWCHPTILSSVVPFSSCPQSSQHQGLFKWVNSLHQVAKVLEFQLQHQSLKWTPKTDLL